MTTPLTTTTLDIPTPDGKADAFVAFPADGGPHPAVLLHMDIFGLRPELEAKARELAAHGYYVLVPNVFYRGGAAPLVELPAYIDGDNRGGLVEQLMPILHAHTTDRVLTDAQAYLDFLAACPDVRTGKVGVIGYCMGAVHAVRTAAAHPDRVGAVAGFHPGRLVTEAPDSPHRLLATVTAPVHLGAAPGDLSPGALEELRQVLAAAGVADPVEIYPDTFHGFTMSDTSAFSADALRRHWERLLPLLETGLAAS
ncbi:dienelactone hydrolase family protein [Kitasatospora viridis]|uniref:Carboxymethylenebutenolidase n=1 Tax=Kitasatospora viridis TaxID=281105 RepID=A0A561S9M5_9ACTN|nr:dienelactone hydrolase family protein [Kitasatospora viridis]TWF71571.1 carboxymethylenebutenolidase [Kitasatospora viridis]